MAITANRGAQTRLIFFILVLTVLLTPGLFADDGCGTKCGYRTVCGEKGCVCTDKDDALFTITKTESALIYCVQNCQSNASSCPDNTTCRVLTAGDEWLGCYCSAEAELSDRGQCQGESQFPKPAKPGSTRSPTTSATREVTWSSITSRISEQVTSTTSITRSTEFSSPTEISTGTQTSTKEHPVAKNTSGDPEAWKVGVAGGSGGAVLLALLVLIACVSLRKKKKHRHITTPQHLSNKNGKSNSAVRQSGLPYRNVADLPLSERNGTDNPAYSTVVSETQLSDTIQSRNISTPAGAANKDGGTYDISELYSVVNKPTKIDTARNAELEGLYANYQIPAEKCKQRNEAKTSRNEGATKSYTTAQATNLYNTSNQPGAPESGNLNFAEQKGDYDTAYNAKVQTGPPAHLMCDEYDELLI